MTQGLVSVVVNGRVVAKAITNCDGYNAKALAKKLRKMANLDARSIFKAACEVEFGGKDSALVVMTETETVCGGRADADDLPEAYRATFNDPKWNPRWAYGTAEYTEIVDRTSPSTQGQPQPTKESSMSDNDRRAPGPTGAIDNGPVLRGIERNFTYHPPKADQPERYNLLRDEAKKLALLIAEKCPESRERSLAFTKLEEAIFWANASIARNE